MANEDQTFRTTADIRKFLQRFGSMIYTKDTLGDLVLMEEEVKELHEFGIIDHMDYQKIILILRKEKRVKERMNTE